MPSDSTPRSLADLYAKRRRGSRASAPVAEADATGQLGLGFVQEEAAVVSPVDAPAPQERKVWSVRALVSELRGHVEKRYAEAWVEGEISNCRPAPSGHLYFTLKDGDAQLPVVLFRRQAALLRFQPQDGQAVLVRGSVSVYESRGQLQLIAETLEPRGEGALRLAYEQLRQKLLAEGLFDEASKRPLPRFPKTVGIITSPGGAVLRDIANIVRRRHPCLNLLVYPALMQGTESAAEVQAGVAYFNSDASPAVELIVLARGGGSAEDLWGFNDESLARAIAASGLPVVSAIGHETDFTIADFVADLRAPTPSAAAEIITESYVYAEEQVHALEARVKRGVRFQLMHLRQRLAQMDAGTVLMRTRDLVNRRQQHVDALRFRLESIIGERLKRASERAARAERRLVRQHVARAIHQHQLRWSVLDERMAHALDVPLQMLRLRYSRAQARLMALDPNAVLQRGYALVFSSAGELVRSTAHLKAGDEIVAQLADGQVRARVTGEKE